MADKNDKSSGERSFPDSDAQKAKRPTATLDLEATEVKNEEDARASQNEKKKELFGKSNSKSKGGGFWGLPPISEHLISGIAGGLLVLMLFWMSNMIWGGGAGSDNSSAVAILNARLDVLDAKLKKANAVNGDTSNPSFEEKLNQLETKITAIAGSAKDKDGSHVAEAAAIANLLTEMEGSFDKKLSALKASLEGMIVEKVNKASKDIKKSIPLGTTASGKLNSEIIRELVMENSSGVTQDIATVKKQSSEVNEKIQSYDKTVQQLQKHIVELSSTISALKAQTVNRSGVSSAIDPVSQRVAALEKKLSEVVVDAEQEKLGAKNTALSLAYTGLKRAADRGESFDAEVKAFQALVPGNKELGQLSSFQSKGAPTLRSLETKLKPLIQKILKADGQPKTSSLWAKFSSNAASFVRFRRTGNIPGETTEAILARMEYNIKKGAYDKALSEGKSLKGSAEEEARKWLQGLDARLKLDDVLQKVETGLLSRLGPDGGNNGREIH